jgi:GAF domain-containing protein
MPDQAASSARKRRPAAAQRSPEPLGQRALRIGLRATLLMPLGAAASVTMLTDDGPGLGSLLPLFLGLVAIGATVAFLPWDRLHGTSIGIRILLVWAFLDLLLITIAGRSIGASDAVLPLANAGAFIFFAVVLSPRSQVALLGFMLACDGVVQSSGFEALPFVMLAVIGVLAIFLSRELRKRVAAHDRARVDSERRWSVVGSVSSAAREPAVAEPRHVLEGVVEAIVALGYDTAAIHLLGERGELRLVLPAAAAADVTAGVRTLPDAIRTRVLGEGRDAIVSVKEVGRQDVRGLRASGITTLAATPILLGERPEGVLIVGSADPDGISPREVEAFAMLAATASMALGNARRAEERRQVEEHLAGAAAVRAEVLARLSEEVRKPLGAVTRTSRALRETFGSEDRHRLIERLVASATALDVTLGGSLDLAPRGEPRRAPPRGGRRGRTRLARADSTLRHLRAARAPGSRADRPHRRGRPWRSGRARRERRDIRRLQRDVNGRDHRRWWNRGRDGRWRHRHAVAEPDPTAPHGRRGSRQVGRGARSQQDPESEPVVAREPGGTGRVLPQRDGVPLVVRIEDEGLRNARAVEAMACRREHVISRPGRESLLDRPSREDLDRLVDVVELPGRSGQVHGVPAPGLV